MQILSNQSDYKDVFPKLSPELVKAVIEQSNLLIGEYILKGEDFVMPHNLGIVFVGKSKSTRTFDYIHWCNTGEFKKQPNIKTFGYTYKVMWFKGYKSKHTTINNLYKFTASRYKIKRPLAKILKAGDDFYKDEAYIKRFYNGNKSKV